MILGVDLGKYLHLQDRSKDLQMVNISLRVLSRPDASTLPTMYRQLGLDYDEKVGKDLDIMSKILMEFQ